MSWTMPLLAALLIGVTLGLFGSGGSILTVPVLIFLLDMPEKLAISTALGVVALISFGAVLPYVWRRQVAGRLLAQLALPGMAGAALGGYASQWLPALVQLLILAVLMLLSSVNMWRSQPWQLQLPRGWQVMLAGTVLGLITGLVGVGGGFLLVPLLLAISELSSQRVVATSLALVFLQSCSGFISLWWSQPQLRPDLWVVGSFGLIGVVGSLLGLLALQYLPQQLFRRAFALFLPVLAVSLVLQHWR